MTTPRKWRLHANESKGATKYGEYSKRACIIVPSEKQIVLTSSIAELLGNPEYVLLYYEDGDKIMGIKPIKKDDPLKSKSYRVTAGGNKTSPPGPHSSRFISCKTFLLGHNIHLSAVFSTITVENDLIVIDLTRFEPLKIHI